LTWDKIPKGTLTAIVKGSDIIAHSLGLGHQNELRPLKSLNCSLLPETWEALSIKSKSDQESISQQAQSVFQRELQLYTGGS